MKVTVLDGQSLFDLAIQHSGSIEAVFEMASANGLSVTDDLVTGTELETVSATDKPVAKYYSNNGLKPATALTTDDQLVAAELEGISYWAINVDFVVQ